MASTKKNNRSVPFLLHGSRSLILQGSGSFLLHALTIFCLLFSTCSRASSSISVSMSNVNVVFEPADEVRIPIGEKRNVTINITAAHYVQGCNFSLSIPHSILEVVVFGQQNERANAMLKGALFSLSNGTVLLTLDLKGILIGKEKLFLSIFTQGNHSQETHTYDVIVQPPESMFGLVPMIGMFASFATNTFAFSLCLEVDVIKAYIGKPIELAIMMGGKFLLSPGISLLLGMAMDLPINIRFTMLVLAACPSGAFSNLCSVLLRTKLNLNVLGLIITPIFAIVMMPFWVYVVGSQILKVDFPDHVVKIPWLVFFVLILLFGLPGYIGVVVCHFFARAARILSLIIRPIVILFATALVCLTIYNYSWVLAWYGVNWRITVSAIIFPIAVGLITFCVSLACKRTVKIAATIMLQCAIPNPSFCLLFSLLVVPQPYGVVGFASVGIYFFTLGGFALFGAVCLRLHDRLCKTKDKEIVTDEQQTEKWNEDGVSPETKTDEILMEKQEVVTIS